MDSKDDLKEKVTSTLANWKAAIDGLKPKIEQLEGDAKEKIEEQFSKWRPTIDSVKGKAEQAEVEIKEKLHNQLEALSATSHGAWDQVKSSAEQGWSDLTLAAKSTMAKVRNAMTKPSREEEIRQIAYHIWLDEGCPDGRHHEHWLKAEEIWHARQSAQAAEDEPRPKRVRKNTAAPRTRKTAARTNIRSRRPPQAPGK